MTCGCYNKYVGTIYAKKEAIWLCLLISQVFESTLPSMTLFFRQKVSYCTHRDHQYHSHVKNIATSFGGSLRKEKFTSLTVSLRTWLWMSSPRPSPHLKSSILLVNWPHHNLRGIVGMANIHGPLSVSLCLRHYLKHSIDNTHYLHNI